MEPTEVKGRRFAIGALPQDQYVRVLTEASTSSKTPVKHFTSLLSPDSSCVIEY